MDIWVASSINNAAVNTAVHVLSERASLGHGWNSWLVSYVAPPLMRGQVALHFSFPREF